jgi:hypothetical protein
VSIAFNILFKAKANLEEGRKERKERNILIAMSLEIVIRKARIF